MVEDEDIVSGWVGLCVGEASRVFLEGGDGGTAGCRFIIGLIRSGRSGVETPPGLERLIDLLGLGELKVARLLWDDGAFGLRLEAGDQLGLQTAGLLGVQVTHLLRNINQRSELLVVALLRTLLGDTASTADLHRQLLAPGVSHKLAGLLLNVAGGAGGLVDGPALLRTLAVADLLERTVALLHGLLHSLLLEGDLTALLKVLLTNLFLSRRELSDIGVVALLHIPVVALQDGVSLQGLDILRRLDTAEAGLRISLTGREVDAGSLQFSLAAASDQLDPVCSSDSHEGCEDSESLQRGAKRTHRQRRLFCCCFSHEQLLVFLLLTFMFPFYRQFATTDAECNT